MIILVMGADGGEELFEWSLLSDGELPVGHIKSCFSQLLEEGILGFVILPVDLMSACLNMYICCPGGEDLVVLLDVVHLGHPEGVVLGIRVEATGESHILYCGFGFLVHLLNEGVDRCVDVSPDVPRVEVSCREIHSLHHLTSLLGDEGQVRIPTFLGEMVDDNYIHLFTTVDITLWASFLTAE